jgi:hypothetical protein
MLFHLTPTSCLIQRNKSSCMGRNCSKRACFRLHGSPNWNDLVTCKWMRFFEKLLVIGQLRFVFHSISVFGAMGAQIPR